MAAFAQWVADLPQQVQTHLEAVGLTSAQRVVDSVQPEYLQQPDGNVITITVDAVFLGTIVAACDQVKKGGGNYAMVRQFYDRCFKEVTATEDAASASAPEAMPVEAKDAQCEEYYELQPEYRRRRLAELDAARRCEVDESRRPSQRMWGRWERFKRLHKEFEPVAPNKVQSEAAARQAPAAAMLMPAAHGALAWRFPPMEARPADSLLELEDHCFIIENLVYLVGWVKDIACLDTFHSRFWTRVRHTRKRGPASARRLSASSHRPTWCSRSSGQGRPAATNSSTITLWMPSQQPPMSSTRGWRWPPGSPVCLRHPRSRRTPRAAATRQRPHPSVVASHGPSAGHARPPQQSQGHQTPPRQACRRPPQRFRTRPPLRPAPRAARRERAAAKAAKARRASDARDKESGAAISSRASALAAPPAGSGTSD